MGRNAHTLLWRFQLNEQQVNDKLIFNVLNFIDNAEDRDEARFVLIVAEKTIQQYVLSMEKFGLFDEWWDNEHLIKEAKKFLKDPIPSMFSAPSNFAIP